MSGGRGCGLGGWVGGAGGSPTLHGLEGTDRRLRLGERRQWRRRGRGSAASWLGKSALPELVGWQG